MLPSELRTRPFPRCELCALYATASLDTASSFLMSPRLVIFIICYCYSSTRPAIEIRNLTIKKQGQGKPRLSAAHSEYVRAALARFLPKHSAKKLGALCPLISLCFLHSCGRKTRSAVLAIRRAALLRGCIAASVHGQVVPSDAVKARYVCIVRTVSPTEYSIALRSETRETQVYIYEPPIPFCAYRPVVTAGASDESSASL